MDGTGAPQKPKRTRSVAVCEQVLEQTAMWLAAAGDREFSASSRTRAECIRSLYEPIRQLKDAGRSWSQIAALMAESPSKIRLAPSTLRNAFDAATRERNGGGGKRRRYVKKPSKASADGTIL